MPTDDNGRFSGWCGSIVWINVKIRSGGDPDIIEYAFTEIMDVPLAMRTAQVYAAWKRDAAEKARQAELEKAKKTKPVF
jgi:hypothetical protein